MRIVSLLSSATEIVYLLGVQDSLVGISHECDYPAEALDRPRVSRVRFDLRGLESAQIDAAVRQAMEQYGSVYEVNEQVLRVLQPDLVLTQAVCEVCAVPTGSVREAISALPNPPRVVSLDAHTIGGILQTIRQVADAAGRAERGRQVVARLEERLAMIAARAGDRPRPRVLLLEWLDPPFAPGHWVPEMVGRAGGECVVGEAGLRSRQVRWEDLANEDPDVLLVEPCGYDLERALADAERYSIRLCSLAPRAIDSGRAWALDSAVFSRSGPRVVDGIQALAAILHPQIFPRSWSEGLAAPL